MSGFRQSQSALHTWAGLVVGWVLFSIFLAGTISYWREDVNRWMRPELGRAESSERLVSGAVRFLARTAPDAEGWYIAVPDHAASATEVFWQPKRVAGEPPRRGRRRDTQALVAPNGELATVRETRGGDFLYRFHFDLHYVPVIWARWFVGFCAMMMLVAIVSGIITHKKIFADFFTFRRAKGQRSWLDGHNALAVLALPFHLMITYTGLVTLMTLYMPWAAVANYAKPATLIESLYPDAGVVARSGTPARLVDPVLLMRDATARWGGAPVGVVRVDLPGDAASRITVSAGSSAGVSARRESRTYAGSTGRLIWRSPQAGAGGETVGVLIGLHAGRYAPDALRWLYFLSGIGGTLMVASGLVLWTVKRREKLPDPQRPPFGFWLVERLNIGFVAGFPLAIAGYFWANRLLPTTMRGRPDAEVTMLFLTWAAALLCAFVLPAKKAWIALLAACGVALALLPLWDLPGARGVIRSAAGGDLRMVALNLVLLVSGGAFLSMARKVARYRRQARRAGRRAAVAATEPSPLLEAAE